jgi:hypothetical protein
VQRPPGASQSHRHTAIRRFWGCRADLWGSGRGTGCRLAGHPFVGDVTSSLLACLMSFSASVCLPVRLLFAQVNAYVQAAFGGVEPCRKAILLDFFRHAFDGSGAGGCGGPGGVSAGGVGGGWAGCRRRVHTTALLLLGVGVGSGRGACLVTCLRPCSPCHVPPLPHRQLLRCRQLH